MISGPPTSKATSAPTTASTAIRSRSPISTRASCSPATACFRPKGDGVRPVFDRLFREYGLPRAIRTDNGVPFATTGIHGLSQLNVWWMRFGIQHQRILPGQPQQNGAHERMHKTFKAEAIRPPRATLARPATRVQCVPPGVQRRAPAPTSPRSNAGVALSPLATRVRCTACRRSSIRDTSS